MHSRTSRCLLLATAMMLLAAGSSQSYAQEPLPVKKPATDGKVWGALIYASQGEAIGVPADVPANLKDLPLRLAKVFPSLGFEIIGQHHQDIFRQYESWVVP